jgi:hypothetical protein
VLFFLFIIITTTFQKSQDSEQCKDCSGCTQDFSLKVVTFSLIRLDTHDVKRVFGIAIGLICFWQVTLGLAVCCRLARGFTITGKCEALRLSNESAQLTRCVTCCRQTVVDGRPDRS